MANILKDQINLKQVDPHTYTVSHHADWSMGPVLHGGSVAAAIHQVASTHINSSPELAALNQPDILTLHIEFLRACECRDSSVVVTHLKLGNLTSTIQLALSQGGKLRAFATATSINFDAPAGPSSPTGSGGGWKPSPALPPLPNFPAILSHEPDENWIPAFTDGELIPLTRRMLALHPRQGHPVQGVVDTWNTFLVGDDPSKPSNGEKGHTMDSTHLTLMTDIVLSLSDTLLRNDGLYDAHATWGKMSSWAAGNPGKPAPLTNSLGAARKAEVFNNTITLDIEFKRRIGKNGVGWTFTRSATRMLEGGRMDLDVVICDEGMEVLCLARQVVLVLGAGKKFGGGGGGGGGGGEGKKRKGPSL